MFSWIGGGTFRGGWRGGVLVAVLILFVTFSHQGEKVKKEI
ncbi:MAG: hypothetical protein WC890_07900 [Candidatus Margulisiibacteriota bacterium]